VGKAAEVAIFALGDLAWVEVAELSLVFLTVVEAFDPVVGSLALVSFGALFSLSELA
jgi:hypothetical protein